MTRYAILVLFAVFCFGCSSAEEAGDDAGANAKLKANGEKDNSANSEDDDEIRSPIGKIVVELLDETDGGSDEERDLVMETLRKNDKILVEASGRNAKERIERANNTHRGPRITQPPGSRRRGN